MDITTFRAKTMQDAIRLIREKLGPDAAVLYSREVPTSGINGWFGATELEVAASNQAKLKNRLPEFGIKTTNDFVEPEEEDPKERLIDGLVYHDQDGTSLDNISPVASHNSFNHANPALTFAYQKLLTADVDTMTANRLIAAIEYTVSSADEPEVLQALRKEIEGLFITGKSLPELSNKQQIISVVGPTGVGKTTTIAKLAAKAKFELKKNVGLITVDTYRIAAVDQLRTYAEIMDLPMQVVSTPLEIRDAIAQLSGCDYILIDTAGRSPRDELQIQELHSILKAATPDETYLVLSATSSTKVLLDAVERFSKVRPTAYAVTKLDEVQSMGTVLNMVSVHSKPISYITNGQDVPHAIAIAQPKELAKKII